MSNYSSERDMARILLMIIATTALLMGSSTSDGEEIGVIYVSGKVLCQDCTQGWKGWIHGSNPLNGSIVSVTCMDDMKKVMHYESDECDETGAYEITINKYINGKRLDPTKCLLRLVSSPDPVCNIATDFSGGRSGVMLKNPNVVCKNIEKYMWEPLYYTTPMCADPDFSYDDSNEY